MIMKYELVNDTLIISDVKRFDLAKCCSCGQAFRWVSDPNGMDWYGVVRSRPVKVSQEGDRVLIHPCKAFDEQLFIDYFDLERDYESIEALIRSDPRLSVCLPGASGIRVFNQEPFEALISFIISANNNIKRISGIIDRLCRFCGDQLQLEDRILYSFPTPDRIAALTDEELKNIGVGYRAPYIRASAKRIQEGYELETIRSMSLTEARKEILTFMGVGPKVADCILLFSLGHTDAFPVDVWIGRAMKELFFDSEPPTKAELNRVVESIGKYSGIVQQYIFHHARMVNLGKK